MLDHSHAVGLSDLSFLSAFASSDTTVLHERYYCCCYDSWNKKSQSNLGRAASPPLTQRIPLVTMGGPTFTFRTALPFDDLHFHIIPLFLDRPHWPFRTACRSNQPFRHSTDRQTHGISDRPERIPAYTLLYYRICCPSGR